MKMNTSFIKDNNSYIHPLICQKTISSAASSGNNKNFDSKKFKFSSDRKKNIYKKKIINEYLQDENITEAEGISAYWRKNTSCKESEALANLLRAIKKVVGYLGHNNINIEYAGMNKADKSSVFIEPAMVIGKYPIPPKKVDNVIGFAINHAIYKIEWSDYVFKLLEKKFKEIKPVENVIFQKIIFGGECIYINHIANKTILGKYTINPYKNMLSELKRKFNPLIISIDELIYLWLSASIIENCDKIVLPIYQKPLIELFRLSNQLYNIDKKTNSITRRCELRKDFYLNTFNKIIDNISGLKILDKKLYWFSFARLLRKNEIQSCNNQSSTKEIKTELLREIELKLALHSSDITPLIRSVVGYDKDVAHTSRWDFNIAAHPVIDKKMVSRLKAIFLRYGNYKRLQNRGNTSGKIDRRRLYRAPVSGTCFYQTDKIPSLDWGITLLMDASGSMRGSKWRMVESTVANIHKALICYKNRLQAYAYFESDGICMISSLIKKNQLLSVPPSGQTASGQAIIAAAYYMTEKRMRNILIHVTDGMSNFGCDVQYGIDYCKLKKINLITLACGYKDKKAMQKQYANNIQFIDSFSQLAHAIENLLKSMMISTN